MLEYEDVPANAIMRCFKGIKNALARKGWIKPNPEKPVENEDKPDDRL